MQRVPLLALGIVLSLTCAARSQPVRDYDRRACAALFTLVAPKVGGKWAMFDASKVTRTNLTSGLSRFHFPPDDEKYVYGIVFGKGKFASAYRIEVGYDDFFKGMAEKDRAKWKGHNSNDVKDQAKIEIYYKDPAPGDFHEINVRQKIGGLQLSVTLRNPTSESLDKAVELALARLTDLVFMCGEYKLFSGGKIRQVILAADGKEQGDITAQREALALGAAPTQVTVRVEVLDDEGNPHPTVKELAIELDGPLAGDVRIEVPGARKDGKRFIIEDPKVARVDVRLQLPAATAQVEATLLAERKIVGPGVRIRATARLK